MTRWRRRRSCSSPDQLRRRPQRRSSCLTADYIVRQRAARDALRHSQHLRQPLPARHVARRDHAAVCSASASLLTVTSYPNRTSVVTRGRWVLANLLGAPPPPPPPDVPALREAGRQGSRDRCANAWRFTARARRAQSVTGAWIPSGFALENFDADRNVADHKRRCRRSTRRRRCPTARVSKVPSGLRSLLVSHQEDFARTLTAKLLAYAIGRGVEYHDLPAVRQIARDAAADEFRWSSIIEGIVKSPAFSMSTLRAGPSRTARRREIDRLRGACTCSSQRKRISRRTDLARAWRSGCAAAARQHDSRNVGDGTNGGEAVQPFRPDVCAQRHDHEELSAGRRRCRLRDHPDAERDCAVSRTDARAERAEHARRPPDVPAARTPRPARGS